MGEQADILAVERRTTENGEFETIVTYDAGGGDTGTAQHVGAPGDDAHPIPGVDLAELQETAGNGARVVTGYTDPKNAQKTAPGERRLYSRDEAGELVGEIWLKNTGELVIELFRPTAAVRIKTDGPVIIDSPDVRVGRGAGKPIATVGSIVTGTLHGTCGPPGSPLAPGPPIPGAGVPFTAKVVSGSITSKS
jgi:hypothetical protein